MNVIQKHLTDNYPKYLRMFTGIFKDDSVARAGISRAYCTMSTTQTVPDNIDVFVYTAIKNSCRTEMRGSERKVDEATNYYETEKEYVMAIDATYNLEESIVDRMHAKKRWARAYRAMGDLPGKSQLIAREHVMNDISLADIARKNDWNIDTTKALYRYAVQCMKTALQEENL